MAPKIRIVSEWLEPYDLMGGAASVHPSRWTPAPDGMVDVFRCCGTGPENSGPPRIMALSLLQRLHIDVVPFGSVADLRERLLSSKDQMVVAYTDPWRHAGQGKRLARLHDKRLDPSMTASLFVTEGEDIGRSLRVIQFGRRAFAWTIRSNGWASNVGACIGAPREIHSDHRLASMAPIVGLDLVWGRHPRDLTGPKRWLACDLNFAPGTRNHGLREVISDSEIVKAIEDWHDWAPRLAWGRDWSRYHQELATQLGSALVMRAVTEGMHLPWGLYNTIGRDLAPEPEDFHGDQEICWPR